MDLQRTSKIKKLGGNRKYRNDDEYRRMTTDKKQKYELVELNQKADKIQKQEKKFEANLVEMKEVAKEIDIQ